MRGCAPANPTGSVQGRTSKQQEQCAEEQNVGAASDAERLPEEREVFRFEVEPSVEVRVGSSLPDRALAPE
jgi:hypothetical protein